LISPSIRPGSLVPPSIEAVRSRHALSKQMSEPEGSIRSPVPGKRERFTSTRCCGLDQRNGTDGESRHTRSKETDVNDESTFSRRRRSQYARSSEWRRYRASKSHTGGTISENGACLRRSLQVEDRFAEGSWKNRRTSKCSVRRREMSSHDVNGKRGPPMGSSGYADMFH
jgi:hypothetical protein